MAKGILYRWFGLGSVPAKVLPALREEGIVLSDEGISGSVTYQNFRAPGRRSGYRRSGFMGSLVLTQKSLAAFTFSKPIVHLPMQAEFLAKIECVLEGESTLLLAFDASAFDDASSGRVEARFNTTSARLFLD